MPRSLRPVFLLGIALAACGCGEVAKPTSAVGGSAGGGAAKGGKLFAVSFQTMNNPFFVDHAAQSRGEIDEEGVVHGLERNGEELSALRRAAARAPAGRGSRLG
ncbi:MAG TPA: hypothetical protein VNC50_03800, partial [Planctomycetia bacterium]|nr:hypothetical protein [Planctomycetia bacterium]